MRRTASVWIAIGILMSIVPVTRATAQVSPTNMKSGCTSLASGPGLLETSLYVVPAGYNFVLTDLSFSPTGYGVAPVPSAWAVSFWVRNFNFNNDVRWVSGGLWDASGNHNWPVRTNWSTGIVFPAGEALRFGISGGAGNYPASTVCWSGYLVPTATSSVIPTAESPKLAMSAAPNPATRDVELRFDLARSQAVVVGVFSVEGRRIRTLARGTLAAGPHRVSWDGRDDRGTPVADGMYFARLEAEDGARTTRIVRIR